MNHINMSDVNDYIAASKNVLDIYKTLVSLLPRSDKHADIEKRIDDAEKALRASEVQLARTLGYNLCQCTFPPQIMLSKGRHPTHDNEIFKCAECGKQQPSEAEFKSKDRFKTDLGTLGGRLY